MSKSSLSSVYQYSSESGHLQRGLADIQQGVRRRLWWDLAKRDLRERYHGAALGVVWVLITTAMLSAGLAVIYSQVFSVDMAQFLPYVTAGISVWSFVSGLLTDSTQVFTTAASYFKQLPIAGGKAQLAPLPVSVFSLVPAGQH